MTARLLEGEPLAAAMRAEIARDVKQLHAAGKSVCLATLLVGEKPESLAYVKSQRRACAEVGISFRIVQVPDSIGQAGLARVIEDLNRDPGVHGIILQVPLPGWFDARVSQRTIDPQKDAEGVHPVNLGLIVYGVTQRAPCTAIAAYHLLKSTGVDLYGKEAVVVGASQIVGKPLGLMLLHDYCTVSTCHIATADLGAYTRRADIVIAACGVPKRVTREMLKPGAIVVDIGYNRVPLLDGHGQPLAGENGRPRSTVVGDVDFEGAKEVAAWITPVPGGVGPLTVAMLLRNVAEAAK